MQKNLAGIMNMIRKYEHRKPGNHHEESRDDNDGKESNAIAPNLNDLKDKDVTLFKEILT
jgi:formiminotetrahydrofolate cyclodeaminase